MLLASSAIMEQFHFKNIFHHWGVLLRDKKFRLSFIIGLSILVASLIVNFFATRVTSEFRVVSVPDLILDRIPAVDLSFLYVWGIYFIVLVIILYPLLIQPEIASFTAKTIAAFILIRSFFILLTHTGVPAEFYNIPQWSDLPFIRYFYTNDLFFSGHTGLPFLAALLFWENRVMRYFFLSASVIMAVTVLLMHAHYSIDVFAAYFITYSIYKVSDGIFNRLNLHFRRLIEKWERQERILGRVIRRIKTMRIRKK